VTGRNHRSGLHGSSGRIIWLFAVAVFCWIAAHWIWRALAPAPLLSSPPPVGDFAAAILSGPALGFARPPMQSTVTAPVATAVDPKIRLMGLAREAGDRAGRDARALFRIDRRILWLRVGDELDRGVTLAAIDAEGVRIDVNGRETRLPLREPRPVPPRPATSPVASGVASTPTPTSPAAAGDTCKLTPEQRSRAYILRPEIIEGVVRERNGWTDLFKPAGVGLAVQNPGGTGAMLGLYGNDILTRADGAQLANLDDVVRLILEPLARNETVVVSGLRAGQPREWIYAGVNCLAR